MFFLLQWVKLIKNFFLKSIPWIISAKLLINAIDPLVYRSHFSNFQLFIHSFLPQSQQMSLTVFRTTAQLSCVGIHRRISWQYREKCESIYLFFTLFSLQNIYHFKTYIYIYVLCIYIYIYIVTYDY